MAAMTWGAALAIVIAMAPPAATQTLGGAELLAAPGAGGYVIYFCHADTDHSRQDRPRVNLDDCATQHVLSGKGRETAIVGHGYPYYSLIGKGQMLEEREAAIVLRDDRGAGSCGRRRASRACSGAFIHGYV
jgi:hypothetical protein